MSRNLFPSHLSGRQPTGIHPHEPIAQFELGLLKNFVYLLLDWPTRQAAVIDPQSKLSPLYEALGKHSFQLKMILLTHTHFDHIAGVSDLLKREPALSVFAHTADLHRLSEKSRSRTSPVHDQQILSLGQMQIQVLHTPGHSAGECCFWIDGTPPYLLTGDTLFIRDCGRTDLETGSSSEMFESLQKIKKLPPETVILPGHHYKEECASTLKQELMDSPPLQCKTVQELERLP